MSTIYIRTTGNDTTGNGSENSPYLTAQKAFEVAYVNNGDYILDFGAGSFGGVNLNTAYATEWPNRIGIRGVSNTTSFLGGINGNGIEEIFDWESGTLVQEATSGRDINIISNQSINIGNILSNGGAASGGSDGYHGGFIDLIDCVCNDITAYSNGTYGGASGGNVKLTNSSCYDINVKAGYSNDSFYNSSSGSGGNVNLISSFCNSINAQSGDYYIYASNSSLSAGFGGNITMINSNCISIDCRSGVGDDGYGNYNGYVTAKAGIVTLIGSCTVPDTVLARSIDASLMDKGYGSFGSSILGLSQGKKDIDITLASLLLHLDGNLDDASPNHLTVAAYGGVNPSQNAKFGGSAVFNGTDGYLSIASQDAINLTGEVPYTIEFWMYIESHSNNYTTVLTRRGGNWQYLLGFSEPTTTEFFFSANSQGDGYSQCRSGFSLPLQEWVHIAATVNNGTARLFVNGILADTQAWATQPDNSNDLFIGQQGSGGEWFHGYVDDLRIVKGLAVYTGPFIPPTAPLSAIATRQPVNASLLLNFDGSFTDESVNGLTVTALGNASLATAEKKFGSGSVQLDSTYSNGAVSCLALEDSSDFGFGSGDFTLEGWFYSDDPTQTNHAMFSVGTYQNGLLVRLGGGSGDPVYLNGTLYQYANGHDFPAATWTHVAVVRNGGLLKVYIGGQEKLSANASDDIGSSRPLYIGMSAHAFESEQYGPTDGWIGYVDSVRVTKAALYCDNFTPPTSPPTPTVLPPICAAPPSVYGCMNPSATNYNPAATIDDGSCIIYGCTISGADNYNPSATIDDGSCLPACQGATCGCEGTAYACYVPSQNDIYGNYCSGELYDPTGCCVWGCMDENFCNYNPDATCDDGSCSGLKGCTNSNASNYNPDATCNDGSCNKALQSYGGFFAYGAGGHYKFWPDNISNNEHGGPEDFELSCLGISWTTDGWQTRNNYGAFLEGGDPTNFLSDYGIHPNFNLRDDGFGLAPISYIDGVNYWLQQAGVDNYIQAANAFIYDAGYNKGRIVFKLYGIAAFPLRNGSDFRMRLAFVERHNGAGDFVSPMIYVMTINEPSSESIPSIADAIYANQPPEYTTVINILQSSDDESANTKSWNLL
jgi:hypothetical protein